jgi:hypothetical protein
MPLHPRVQTPGIKRNVLNFPSATIFLLYSGLIFREIQILFARPEKRPMHFLHSTETFLRAKNSKFTYNLPFSRNSVSCFWHENSFFIVQCLFQGS